MKNIIRISTIVMIFTSLQGCWFWTGAAIGGAGAYVVAKDDRPVGMIIDDTSINTAVKSALIRDDYIKAGNINVDTEAGIVTLHGYADSQTEVERAIRIAESIKGVRRVESFLKVIPPTNSAR